MQNIAPIPNRNGRHSVLASGTSSLSLDKVSGTPSSFERSSTQILVSPSFPIMTRLGTLRVIAPPPSPTQTSPQQVSTPAQQCRPPQTPHTPSSSTPNASPHPSPPTPSPRDPTPTRQPPLSKNLRWTAVALVSKLSKELERPSSAIADEVALAASHDTRTRFPQKDVAPVERNTRRRVYDALKVMVAVGCIQRHGKDLRWIGVDHLRYFKPNNGPNIRVSLCESRRRIGRKKAMLTDLNRTIKSFEALYTRRHREQQWQNHHPTPLAFGHRIQFPMVAVNAQHPQVTYTPDRRRVRVATKAPFKVYSETDLVSMLADRTALKRPRVAKKRSLAKTTPVTPHPRSSPVASSASNACENAENMLHSKTTRKEPNQQRARKMRSGAVLRICDTNAGERPNGSRQVVQQTKDLYLKTDDGASAGSARSSDIRKKRRTHWDRNQNSKLQPKEEVLVKSECREAVSADTATKESKQALSPDIQATSEPSARQDAPDTESMCPSVSGTQADRGVAPLICDEELGIPPLADGESSSPGSDDDAAMGWEAGAEGNHDFEQVFRAPMFHQV